MSITDMPLREIAAAHPAAISIFEQFDVDLCAWGEKSLGETCAALRISADQMEEKLHALAVDGGEACTAAHLSLTRLIQVIVREHHRRVRQDLPALARMAVRLASKHPAQSASYGSTARLIQELHADLLSHIEKEEQTLFPCIAAMEQEDDGGYTTGSITSQSVHLPVANMMQEHAEADKRLDELRNRTCDYRPPADACSTQRALYSGLRRFEAGFREHLHLEDDILFPRSIEVESALQQRSRR